MDQLFKNRGFAATVHIALWILIVLAATHLGGKSPEYHERPAVDEPPMEHSPVRKLETLFASSAWDRALPATNSQSPFATAHFIPRSNPAPKPTTRKVALTYQGYFQTGNEPRRVIVKMDNAIVVTPIGRQLTTNLFVSAATLQNLTLTNLAAETNILALNTKKDVEVPLQ